ncbi:hypothetical protein [Ferrovum myxofaciens]|jgi:hypothetical protein|uniref:Uncharacterized protein n=2 Tax=root TaxID=1 RepID=A0A859AE15_9PROT|nr:hypothetical protein [Ferrovum myxofaciens]MBW8029230.1 hypothetical protein [Ferrovum sp.]KXW57557.1 hypothetical protein FEMY_19100 [Ferrovum myxofaciens]MBU6995459.1 hypothetical protein [Ferrovum myxofaciens]NDU89880.1 hypothetical protein [Ferrovum sp.]QKE39239.1 MAG: hypothetical protein HO273_11375 [Ferrovum myxofaciens]
MKNALLFAALCLTAWSASAKLPDPLWTPMGGNYQQQFGIPKPRPAVPELVSHALNGQIPSTPERCGQNSTHACARPAPTVTASHQI